MKLNIAVDIASGFVAPCDGYLNIAIPYGGNGVFSLLINEIPVFVQRSDGGNTERFCIFIKKGFIVTFTNNTSKIVTIQFNSIERV